jgi:hypothetical protein
MVRKCEKSEEIRREIFREIRREIIPNKWFFVSFLFRERYLLKLRFFLFSY